MKVTDLSHFMFRIQLRLVILLLGSLALACDDDENEKAPLSVTGITAENIPLTMDGTMTEGISPNTSLTISFSTVVDRNTSTPAISITDETSELVIFDISYLDNDKTLLIEPTEELKSNSSYTLNITDILRGLGGESFPGMSSRFKTTAALLSVVSFPHDGMELLRNLRPTDVTVAAPTFEITFSAPLDPASISNDDFSIAGFAEVPVSITLLNENKTVNVTTTGTLSDLRKYELRVSEEIAGANEESFASFSKAFYTGIDPAPDFPLISDEELLTKVQEQTFRYFWDFAHPVSGLARERNTSGDIVTSGGSGFGIMSIIVGIERGFISRADGLIRMNTIVNFLESADRFHGAWSHWLNGSTGTVVPFSANDNGGDLVETSFLVQGLLTFRQYLNAAVAEEQTLIDRINVLWEGVEWNWYTQGGQDVLFWHWSPDKTWTMNHQIKGYNESLITYVLAASSPTFEIDPSVYHNGWASAGGIANGKTFYTYTLPLGFDYGGPLFFSHYSFLGLDPRNLSDGYANYWNQNVNHTFINRAYVIDNPKGFVGYSENNWGLTASDNSSGYSAHSPTNDLGVVTPTAAISSLPYTPAESMDALRFFYYTVGDRLWGEYGFYDAFNITEGWTADSYLAIDQGTMSPMIENARTSFLWNLFMNAPDVRQGLVKLGFHSTQHGF